MQDPIQGFVRARLFIVLMAKSMWGLMIKSRTNRSSLKDNTITKRSINKNRD